MQLKKNPQIQKLGRPYALPDEIEQRVVKYIVDMQELGFGLTLFQVRKLAYDLATSQDTEHMFNPAKKVGSKWWWSKLKDRYGLSLRVPENLWAYSASMANLFVIRTILLSWMFY